MSLGMPPGLHAGMQLTPVGLMPAWLSPLLNPGAGATPGSWDFGKADPDSIIKWLASDAEGAATLRVKRDVELKFVDNSHVTIVVR